MARIRLRKRDQNTLVLAGLIVLASVWALWLSDHINGPPVMDFALGVVSLLVVIVLKFSGLVLLIWGMFARTIETARSDDQPRSSSDAIRRSNAYHSGQPEDAYAGAVVVREAIRRSNESDGPELPDFHLLR